VFWGRRQGRIGREGGMGIEQRNTRLTMIVGDII
jgi:hypothetical protein